LPMKADIIIATQAIMKDMGRFQPDMVGLLDVELELHRFDFRAAHRVFSLLLHMRQVAKKKVIVQTYDVRHYPLKAASKLNYAYFYRKELNLRRELGLPPFKHLIAIVLRGENEEKVFAEAKDFYRDLHKRLEDGIDIIEPQPDHIPKLRDQYRFVIVIKGTNPKKILRIIKSTEKDRKRKRGIIVTVNVDP